MPCLNFPAYLQNVHNIKDVQTIFQDKATSNPRLTTWHMKVKDKYCIGDHLSETIQLKNC